MVRLSYSSNEDGNLVSNLFPLNSDMAFVIIFVEDKQLQVRAISDDGGVRLLSSSKEKDLITCKRKARKIVESLGAKFKDEVRRKREYKF